MSRPSRVAFVTSHPIQYQAPLFRALARRPDIDLTVFFGSDRGARPYDDPGFRTRLTWDVPLLEGYRSTVLPRRAGTNPAIVRALRRGRFDAVAVHGWAHVTSWLAFLTAAALRVPIMLRGESHGLRESRGWRRAVKQPALGWLFRHTAAFLAIGTLNRRFYEAQGIGADRIFFAPYAVDNDFFRHAAAALPDRASLRAQLGLPREATVFLFCGKLIGVKRPLDALEAFRGLDGRERAALVYVGDGPLRGAIEARAAGLGNVTITGFRNQTELPRWYAAADVLVLPSAFEPWGLVVNEALNFDLGVIASDQVGAAADLVRGEEGGQVVPVGDLAALRRAMGRALAERGNRTAAGAKRVIDEWTIEHTVDGIVDALAAVGRRR